MARRARLKRDGAGDRAQRPLLTRLGRRGSLDMAPPVNDNRAPGLHRVRGLVSPARVIDTLLAWIAGR